MSRTAWFRSSWSFWRLDIFRPISKAVSAPRIVAKMVLEPIMSELMIWGSIFFKKTQLTLFK
jgi:hypothetical protein